MSCGSWGAYYTSRTTTSQEHCEHCSGYSDECSPRFELGKVDVFKLARLLKEKRDKEEDSK